MEDEIEDNKKEDMILRHIEDINIDDYEKNNNIDIVKKYKYYITKKNIKLICFYI
jgi:hypothetical protein